MGFLTEMFSRPRHQEAGRFSTIAAVAAAWSETRRIDETARPADFPRNARTVRLR
jgi:hypothetical protein